MTTSRLESIVRSAVDDRGRRCAAATTLRPRLISDGVADGVVATIPDDYLIIETIVYGPYLDTLNQVVYLALVNGGVSAYRDSG
eukprot:3452758-Rhodomonas_salina.1